MSKDKLKVSEDIDVIECYIRGLIQKFKENKWTNDNTLTFSKKKEVLGSVKLDDKTLEAEGDIVIKELKILVEKRKEAEAMKITEEKAKASVFKNAFQTKISYNGLIENPDLFNSLSKSIDKLGIKEVKMKTQISKTESVQDNLTLFIDSSVDNSIYENKDGFYRRLRTALYEKVETDASSADNLRLVENGWIKKYKNENVVELKIKGTYVGNYYKERNIVQLFFNPFMMKKILPIQDDYTEAIALTLGLLTESKLKTVSTESFKQQLFVRSFLANSEKRLRDIGQQKRDAEKHIADYERAIQTSIMSLGQYNSEIEYIERNLSLNGKGLYEEIQNAKKLPFVTNIKLETDSIDISFKKTCLVLPAFKRDGLSFGKKTIYMSPITYRVKPGSFELTTENKFSTPGNNNIHPHSSGGHGHEGWDTPCMGEGAGRNKVYEMLAANKFTDLAKLLWFWIKTFRSDEAHIHNPTVYDSRLSDGLPVWNAKGKRIEINDPELIKSGEQRQLDKNDCYEANIKKFKTEKIC